MPKNSALPLILAAFLLSRLCAYAEWETWKDCTLIPNEDNDGDSFHIEYNRKEYIIRLYFVDAPETGLFYRGADRQVAVQAAHFEKTPEEVIHAGKYAQYVAERFLSRPFSVLTEGTDARGNSSMGRIYGFVTTSDGEDLAEVLVANGLARSYGMAVSTPRRDFHDFWRRYDQLEDRARRSGIGVYSPNPVRTIVRAKNSPVGN